MIDPAHPSHIRCVELDGQTLTIHQVVAVARYRAQVSLSPAARRRVALCRVLIDFMVTRGIKVYGLTTGFGSKRDVFVPPEDTQRLQGNLIQSHAAGVGEPLSEDVTRAAILLRANTLARGHSGIRVEVLERLIDMINCGIYPFVPAKGSVGASGDLAPLSHLALVLIGHPGGRVYGEHSADPNAELRAGMPYVVQARKGEFVASTEDYLSQRFGFQAIRLEAKEGLALNNGTQIMTAIGALCAYDADVLVRNAEVVCAASLEALKAVPHAFDPRIHAVRAHPGQQQTASNLRRLLQGSEILASPMNLAFLRKVYRSIEQALQQLIPHPIPLIQAIVETLYQVLAELDAIRKSPLEHIERGERLIPAEELEQCPPEYRRLLGAHEALWGIQDRLLKVSGALISPALPLEAYAARDKLTHALRDLEQAVPGRPRVQDDYSLRCSPQVLGATRDAIAHAWRVLEVELNAATDNPLIFPPQWFEQYQGPIEAVQDRLLEADTVDAVLSGGNFHGEPIGMVMDYLKIAIAEVGSLSERRTAHLVDGHHNQGLPSLLIENSGLNSGLMIPQYTAAALVSENKVLAHPATVDSIPTCENTEDHVSMGTIAARQAAEILQNVELVVGIEALCAFQALHFRQPLNPGRGTRAFLERLCADGLTHVDEDRVLYRDIELVARALRRESVLEAVEQSLEHPLDGR